MRITLPSGTAAEIARPTGADPDAASHRGLVVIPDVGGLRPLFHAMCQRLADETGATVVSAELWPGKTDKPIDWRLDHVAGLRDDDVLGDIIAAADATGAPTVSVLGFCMGGMYTLKAAGIGRFHRAVAFYGIIRLPDRWRGPTQSEPLDALARPGACPVLAIIGTGDELTPPDDVDALEAAGATVVRYDGAEHGFVHDPNRPAHRPADAADAWSRAIAFLNE